MTFLAYRILVSLAIFSFCIKRSFQLTLELKTNIKEEDDKYLDLAESNITKIEIKCEATLSETDEDVFKNFVIIKRCLPATEDGRCILDKNEDVSDGDTILAVTGKGYKTPNRYSVTVDGDEKNIKRETLVIDDPKPEDGGTYVCKIPRVTNPLTLSKTISIYSPPETFSMKVVPRSRKEQKVMLYESFNEKESLVANENDEFTINCSISKTFPLHQLEVLIDDEPLKDIKMGAMKYKTYRTKKNGIDVTLYSSSREVILPFKYEYDGKSIKCAAYVKGVKEKSLKTVGVNIAIESYTPKFLCDSVQYAESNTRQSKLKCRVISKPGILTETAKFTYTYELLRGKDNFTLTSSSYEGHYFPRISKIKNNLYEMTLKIDYLTRRSYTDYYFEVGNKRGNTIKHIVLKKRKVSQRVLMNGNGGLSSNFSVKTIFLLIGLLLAMQ